MSSFSLTSSPTRCIGWPQSAFGQVVSAGSWWCSTRCRCSGSAWRRGRRGASLGTTGACGRWACSATSCACRLASSSARVSANSARCCAVMASVLAPNFQRFRRASSSWSFSSFASRQTISRSRRSISQSLRSISPACCSMCWRMRASTATTSAGNRCSSMGGSSCKPGMRRMVPAPAGPHHWRKHRCQQQCHPLQQQHHHHHRHRHPHDFRHG
jgi:hypothetical protein